jgi:hypothetical protein
VVAEEQVELKRTTATEVLFKDFEDTEEGEDFDFGTVVEEVSQEQDALDFILDCGVEDPLEDVDAVLESVARPFMRMKMQV